MDLKSILQRVDDIESNAPSFRRSLSESVYRSPEMSRHWKKLDEGFFKGYNKYLSEVALTPDQIQNIFKQAGQGAEAGAEAAKDPGKLEKIVDKVLPASQAANLEKSLPEPDAGPVQGFEQKAQQAVANIKGADSATKQSLLQWAKSGLKKPETQQLILAALSAGLGGLISKVGPMLSMIPGGGPVVSAVTGALIAGAVAVASAKLQGKDWKSAFKGAIKPALLGGAAAVVGNLATSAVTAGVGALTNRGDTNTPSSTPQGASPAVEPSATPTQTSDTGEKPNDVPQDASTGPRKSADVATAAQPVTPSTPSNGSYQQAAPIGSNGQPMQQVSMNEPAAVTPGTPSNGSYQQAAPLGVDGKPMQQVPMDEPVGQPTPKAAATPPNPDEWAKGNNPPPDWVKNSATGKYEPPGGPADWASGNNPPPDWVKNSTTGKYEPPGGPADWASGNNPPPDWVKNSATGKYEPPGGPADWASGNNPPPDWVKNSATGKYEPPAATNISAEPQGAAMDPEYLKKVVSGEMPKAMITPEKAQAALDWQAQNGGQVKQAPAPVSADQQAAEKQAWQNYWKNKPAGVRENAVDKQATLREWLKREQYGLALTSVQLRPAVIEGIMDWFKGGKAAPAGDKKEPSLGASTDSLNQAWKAAGSPTDSEEVAKVLQGAGIAADAITKIYTDLKIPAPGAAAPAATPAADPTAQAPTQSGAEPTATTTPAAADTTTPAAAPASAPAQASAEPPATPAAEKQSKIGVGQINKIVPTLRVRDLKSVQKTVDTTLQTRAQKKQPTAEGKYAGFYSKFLGKEI